MHLQHAVKKWIFLKKKLFKVILSNPTIYDVKCLSMMWEVFLLHSFIISSISFRIRERPLSYLQDCRLFLLFPDFVPSTPLTARKRTLTKDGQWC